MAARRWETARLRSTWSRSTSMSALPSTWNRASADSTMRRSAASTVTGDVLRSASWLSARSRPSAETAMRLACLARPGMNSTSRSAPLLGLDAFGGRGEVEQGAAEGDRADQEPAEPERDAADHVGHPVDPEQ